jgi:hypothetical protein
LGKGQVDTSRISYGETVAALSGAALVLFMFVDWFGYDLGEGLFEQDAGGLNAWQWMSFLDVVLFLAAAVAIGVAVARAAGSIPPNPAVSPSQALAVAGAVALLIVVFRLLFPGDGPAPGAELVDPDISRKIGVFFGLIAAAGMAYGGYTALNERASGAAPGASAPPPPPSPPPSEPPPA